MSIEAHGVRVGFRAKDARVIGLIRGRFPFGWKETTQERVDRLYSVDMPGNDTAARVRRFSLLYADDAQLSRTLNPDELLDALESDLRLFVAEHAPRRVFVHAGVVGWKGRAIVIPGRSYSGKTTLVAALIQAGATYYSDEYAVLDARGRVHPYAKPLSIREGRGPRQTDHTVESLGGLPGRKAIPVGLVVVCRWDGRKWRPRELSPGIGTLAMVSNTVSARRHPERTLQSLQRVAATARMIESSRSEARDAAAGILRYAEASLS